MLFLSYGAPFSVSYPVSSMRNRGIPLQVELPTVSILSKVCLYRANRLLHYPVDSDGAPLAPNVPMHPAHLPTHSAVATASPLTTNKNSKLRKTRKLCSKSVKETALGSGGHQKQSPRRKLSGASSRSKCPSTPTAPASNPASSQTTPPGDNTSSTSSISTPSPTLLRSTRNSSVAANPSAAPTSSTVPVPIPTPIASTSGKRKREIDAGADAETVDTSARPTRRRKLSARALEALEAPPYKPCKQRVQRSRDTEDGDTNARVAGGKSTTGPRSCRATSVRKKQKA